MAELYLARQVGVAGFERVLAIKRILSHLTEDAEFIQMFINEAKLAAQITHPNVAQVYDFGSVDGVYYIAMEYIMGKSLSYLLSVSKKSGHPVPLGHAVQITAKIAAGLDHAYRGRSMSGEPLGIIHRDISPQNILIAYNGEVKLVDFGIAKAASSSTHTQTGIIKGKLSYLSPEQAWGKRVDHRSDLFSLGIVLHEMATGVRLFKAENEIATLERVRLAEVPPPSSIKSDIPKEFDPIVLKVLAKDPEERYPTGQAFQEALEGFLRLLNPSPTQKGLSDYLHLLFEKEINKDVSEFKQVTTITKPPVTTPVTTPKKIVQEKATPEAPQEKATTVRDAEWQKGKEEGSKKGSGMAIGIAVAAAALALSAAGWWMLRSKEAVSIPPPVSTAPAAIENPAGSSVPSKTEPAVPAVPSAPDQIPQALIPVREEASPPIPAAPKGVPPSAPQPPRRAGSLAPGKKMPALPPTDRPAPLETKIPGETKIPVETKTSIESRMPVEKKVPIEAMAPAETKVPVEQKTPFVAPGEEPKAVIPSVETTKPIEKPAEKAAAVPPVPPQGKVQEAPVLNAPSQAAPPPSPPPRRKEREEVPLPILP